MQTIKFIGRRVLISDGKFRPYSQVGVIGHDKDGWRFHPDDFDGVLQHQPTEEDAREQARTFFELHGAQLREEEDRAA